MDDAHKKTRFINKSQSHTSGEKPVKRCYNCDSTSHLSFQCTAPPKEGGVKSAVYTATKSVLSGTNSQQANRFTNRAAVNSISNDHELFVTNNDVRSITQANCSKVCVTENQVMSVDVLNEFTKLDNVDVNTEAQLKLAQLHYLKVNIHGSNYCWRALHDSGSEVDVIDRNKLKHLCLPHEVVGSIALRPMAGPAIPAELVKIKMRLTESADLENNYIDIVMAACAVAAPGMCEPGQLTWLEGPPPWLRPGWLNSLLVCL
jgi:hypothetical protein